MQHNSDWPAKVLNNISQSACSTTSIINCTTIFPILTPCTIMYIYLPMNYVFGLKRLKTKISSVEKLLHSSNLNAHIAHESMENIVVGV